MRLTLLRHGVAVEKDEWEGDDAERPLTKDGANEARAMCRAVRHVVKAHEIWTSPWARARATAEIAAMVWKLPLREVAWLAGKAAEPRESANQLKANTDVVLVGHDPDLSALIAYLCGAKNIDLAKCGLAVLKGDPVADGMSLKVLLTPKTVAAIYDGS